MKRGFDIAVGSPMILVVSPILAGRRDYDQATTAVPMLFRQTRVGSMASHSRC